MVDIKKVSKVVIKVGSSLVTSQGFGINIKLIDSLAYQISRLHLSGIKVVLVSSGAIAQGIKSLGWKTRPLAIYKLQAAAAVGQMGLAQTYENLFDKFNIKTAQILLTYDDIKNRTRYLNSRITILTLLDLGIVPIINENDSVSFSEIKLGDNDTLGALVVNLIEADGLIILTDCEGLFEDDPKKNPNASIISSISVDDPRLDLVAKDSVSNIGTGGMLTKVKAARMASQSGAFTIIASGFNKDVILEIFKGKHTGTYFIPNNNRLNAKKKWMMSNLIISGNVYIDNGAKKALIKNKGSLLPVGCVKVEGSFKRGELISIRDEDGIEIARGLSNYSSEHTNKILKMKSEEIIKILGFIAEEELVHRDNMVYNY